MKENSMELSWLPKIDNWKARLREVHATSNLSDQWAQLTDLANARLDFVQTAAIDRVLTSLYSDTTPPPSEFAPVRLAVLASSTIRHLLPAIRVGALRRGIWCQTYASDYGQYLQDHIAESDAREDVSDQAERSLQLLKSAWGAAAERFHCPILQNVFLPVFSQLLGNNEHRLRSSPHEVVRRLNESLRDAADEFGVHLVAIDEASARDGLKSWYDPSLWHHAKQEISPAAAPVYGDLVGRLFAALRVRSYKCLVLDLDNTLLGGVVGDDGVSGIVLGQNSAVGEAYLEFQRYMLRLSRRGIILAVCSKNDEKNALAPFDEHSEMLLKRSDISCFVANWRDKARNIRFIAESLNIGIDSLVFVDDSAFERAQVRRELPMVAVPEIPEDPALFPSVLQAAGYFEALDLTAEDRERTVQYQKAIKRRELIDSASDMGSYLQSLEMKIISGPFETSTMARVAQLISKTNQFNLTTRRYTKEDVARFAVHPSFLTMQLQLLDSLGDNGIIGVVIGELKGNHLLLDTWLMSCRVLGRQVEESTFNLVAAAAIAMGATSLIGEFIPSPKNGMVKEFYEKLGFSKEAEDDAGISTWSFDLEKFRPRKTHIREEHQLNYATN
jgi:FkbH-like protein